MKYAVIGDAMLDVWLDYEITREHNAENPSTPVARLKSSQVSLGGALNVAANLAALCDEGDHVTFYDPFARSATAYQRVCELFTNRALSYSAPSNSNPQPFITKTRHRLNGGLLMRVDNDQPGNVRSRFPGDWWTPDDVKNYAAIIVTDYGKGAVTWDWLSRLIDATHKANVLLILDLKPALHLSVMRGQSLPLTHCVLKANYYEVLTLLHGTFGDSSPAVAWANQFPLHIRTVVTGAEKGAWYSYGVESGYIPGTNNPSIIQSVCGAGDIATAVLAYKLANKIQIFTAVQEMVRIATNMCRSGTDTLCLPS